jgi:hypothetical protein
MLCPFLPSAQASHSQSSCTACLGLDECDGKSGDNVLPIVNLGACDACNVARIFVHYKFILPWCCTSVRSMVHKGGRPKG